MKAPVAVPSGYVSDPFEYDTTVGTIVRRVLRTRRDGPVVVLMHEAPGLSASTFEVAGRLTRVGFTVVIPELMDAPLKFVPTMVRICLAREFGALTRGEPGPIVTWIQGLVARESALDNGRRVGVIGMCFSGGFALATAIDPLVRAVVSSQPALPFGISDLGLTAGNLADVQKNVANGTCIRGLRYRLDPISPGPRLRRLDQAIPSADIEVIPTWNPLRHSVLKDAAKAPEGTPLALTFDRTLTFLHTALGWAAPPEPQSVTSRP